MKWQDRRESNPQPLVLETSALPIELLTLLEPAAGNRTRDPPFTKRQLLPLSYTGKGGWDGRDRTCALSGNSRAHYQLCYIPVSKFCYFFCPAFWPIRPATISATLAQKPQDLNGLAIISASREKSRRVCALLEPRPLRRQSPDAVFGAVR